MKKVAIITINFNNASGLESTIKSVLSQEGVACEFIIIDGASNDNSIEILRKYSNQISFWVSEKDNGIYHAQNKGWYNSTAEYCLFLNSGDELADVNVLNDIQKYLTGIDIIYGDLLVKETNGKITKHKSPHFIDVPFLMVSTLWHPCAFIKRALLQKHAGYNETFKITGDYEFFIRTIIKHNVSTCYIERNLSIFNLDGVSNNEQHRLVQEIERRQSWELNFSTRVIKEFEDYTKLLRSREYKLARLIRSLKFLSGR